MTECPYCGCPLEKLELTLPWEDGDNDYAYVICPDCGAKIILDGYGEDD